MRPALRHALMTNASKDTINQAHRALLLTGHLGGLFTDQRTAFEQLARRNKERQTAALAKGHW